MSNPENTNKGFIIAITLAIVGTALAIGAMGYLMINNQPAIKTFSLMDHNGQAVTEQTYQGKLTLVMFGYTSCPDVCPTGLTVMSDALSVLGKEGDQVVPIFITVDPERDTQEVLKDYVANFHPRLIGLTGSLEQIAAAAKSFGAEFLKVPSLSNKEEDAGTYSMAHTTSTYLTGAKGETLFSFNSQTKPEKMAKRIKKFLKRL